MPTVVIIQARMTSSRLPGKVLLPVLGKPLLAYQLERMGRLQRADRLVVATTVNPTDAPIVALCGELGVPCTRGSELDVLARYAEAANIHGATTVVRLTSDCPLLDPELVDDAIAAFADPDQPCDYLSNMIEPTWPYGHAVEVFTARALAEAVAEATDPAEREHVTPFIYWRPGRYRLRSLTRTPDLSQHRWTVDTPEDFELIRRILEGLVPNRPQFALDDVLDLLARHPDWPDINRHVVQRVAKHGDK